MYSFFSWYNGLTLDTQKWTRIEYIDIFEAEISIGDVFAFTPFINYVQNIKSLSWSKGPNSLGQNPKYIFVLFFGTTGLQIV